MNLEYNLRNLRYESDIVNAFTAIFKGGGYLFGSVSFWYFRETRGVFTFMVSQAKFTKPTTAFFINKVAVMALDGMERRPHPSSAFGEENSASRC
jgi:hypothetical protein